MPAPLVVPRVPDIDFSHLRKLGVIGDLHCEVASLERVLAHFQREGVEASVCVGDLVDGAGDANRALELLEERSIVAVRGNHDRWLLRNELREVPLATDLADVSPKSRRYLASLPLTRSIRCSRGRLLLCHGIAQNDFVGVRPEDSDESVLALPEIAALLDDASFDFVLSGHTHRAMVRRVERLTLFNAGTLHREYRPVCGVLDFHARRYRVFDVRSAAIELAADWSFDEELAFLPR
ncbi:MAG: metallophosphoesterase family protein [Myxococcota bacterium]